jgi:hypothetical protein
MWLSVVWLCPKHHGAAHQLAHEIAGDYTRTPPKQRAIYTKAEKCIPYTLLAGNYFQRVVDKLKK